jgi:hypothetical protein
MSVASILKVYDGLDPELAFTTAAPGTAENIAQVLANAPAGDAGGLPLTDVAAFSCASITKSTLGAAALFTISGEAGQGVSVVGPVGASLIATTGGAKVEASAGVLELNFDGVGGELNIVPLVAQFTPAPLNAAAAGPTYLGAVRQLQIQVGGVPYYIALNPAPFA